MNYSIADAQNQPVTVVVSQLVKPAQEKAFEELLEQIAKEALKFEGHLGINIIRPPSSGHPEYVIIFRFDSYANLKKWMDSDIRQAWVEKCQQLVVPEKGNEQMFTGLETWFSLPGKAIQPPPRYKMTIILWLAVVAMINIVPPIIAPIVKILPPILRSVITSAVIVVLISYLIMPFLTKLFAKWLYSHKHERSHT